MTLNEFKTKIRFWNSDGCPHRLWKTYIAQSGFQFFMAEQGYIFVTIGYLPVHVIKLVLLL